MPTLTAENLADLARAGSPNREIEAALGRDMTADERVTVDRARVVARLQKARKRQERKAAKVPEADPATLLQPMADHVAQDVLSGILGITDRQIRKLAARNVLSRAGRGHYPWPKVVQEYCAFLRGGEEADAEKLKIRELELKCQMLEQKLHDRRTATEAEIISRCWGEVQDCLAEYRAALHRVAALSEPYRKTLNTILGQAIETVNSHTPTRVPDGGC